MAYLTHTVNHAGVVAAYAVGWPRDSNFVAMEFVEGGSLAEALRRPWSICDAARLVEALADTVHVVHQNGLVHREIDPTHILLTSNGQPKLAGFRLAQNLFPDQSSGREHPGIATDIYALGAVLYELLTGQMPIPSDAPAWPTNMGRSIPAELEAICWKCLANQPKDRYASAKALADDLRQYLQKSASRPLGFLKRFWHRIIDRRA